MAGLKPELITWHEETLFGADLGSPLLVSTPEKPIGDSLDAVHTVALGQLALY